MEARLFHADGQKTDMKMLEVTFSNFENAPKKRVMRLK